EQDAYRRIREEPAVSPTAARAETVDQPSLQRAIPEERNAGSTARPNTRSPRVYLKVSSKGAVSLYGLGRFPVTLYGEQWETILEMANEIRNFMADNAPRLQRADPIAKSAEGSGLEERLGQGRPGYTGRLS